MAEQFVDKKSVGGVQKRFNDPEACQQWGGHCWEPDMLTGYIAPIGPSLPPLARTCKHCGMKQRGVYQEPVRWEEVPA